LAGILRRAEYATQLQGSLRNRTGVIDFDGAVSQLGLGLVQNDPQLLIFSALCHKQLQQVCSAESAQFTLSHGKLPLSLILVKSFSRF
jgi:hypothetical protein